MKLVAPKKIRAFDFQKIPTFLLIETKGIELNIHDEYLNFENIAGLMEVFEWCFSHLEVKSVYIKTKKLLGFNPEFIKNSSKQEIALLASNYLQMLMKMKSLPQTIIFEALNNLENEAIAFFLNSDIKISNENLSMKFNQLENGYIDVGLFFIQKCNSHLHSLNDFYLSSETIDLSIIKSLGISVFNFEKSELFLSKISKQSNMARAQSKHAFYKNSIFTDIDQQNIILNLKTVLSVNDFQQKEEFINLRNVKENIADLNLN